MSESSAKPMNKNELAAFTARMECEKYGKKTDLVKYITGRMSRVVSTGLLVYGAIQISKSRPGSIKALCELVEVFKKGNNIGWVYIITLLIMTVVAAVFACLCFICRRQRKRAVEKLGLLQRQYETLLSTSNMSSGINPDGSTP